MLNHIFINLPTLKTERLVLRKLLYSDKKDIFSYAANPKVAKHVLWNAHQTEFDTLEFLNIVYESYNKNRAAPWGISLKSKDKIIGTAGFVSWDKEKGEAEIGYVLAQDYWEKGIISEAVRAIVKFGFNEMMLNKITAECKPENVRSRKVLLKCGFISEGILRNKMLIKGKFEDMEVFSIVSNV